MHPRRLAPAIVLSLALAAAPVPAGAGGDTGVHDITYIENPTLAVRENFGSAELVISRLQHGLAPAEVDYSTAPTEAQAGSDYEPVSGTLTLEPVDSRQVFVGVTDDSEQEDVERFQFTLDAARGGTVLRYPTSATITIVDNDGPARVSFATGSFSTYENRGGFAVTLVRSGADISGEATMMLTSANNTAESGTDFDEVSQSVTFAAEDVRTTVQVRVLNDTVQEDPESFDLALSAPTGAAAAEPSSASVEILDDDSRTSDTTAPVTQFHIPRDGRTYQPGVAREIHLFSSDEASGVAKMLLALRKKMRSGKCAWWTGRRFKGGACSARRWIDMGDLPQNYFVVYRLRTKLKPTTKRTGIRNYTAFGRARDEAGNTENSFESGRNANTYKVR
jgi:hypothetical protein